MSLPFLSSFTLPLAGSELSDLFLLISALDEEDFADFGKENPFVLQCTTYIT